MTTCELMAQSTPPRVKRPRLKLGWFDYGLLLATLVLLFVLVTTALPRLRAAIDEQTAQLALLPEGAAVPEADPAQAADPRTEHTRTFLRLINAAREEARVAPLRMHEQLVSAAQHQSDDMARAQRLDHRDAQGRALDVRLARVGYYWLRVTENVFSSRSSSPESAFQQWWDEESGNDTISPVFTQIGIGITQGNDGVYYYSIILAEPDVLTAPGANINNPGVNTQEGQALEILFLLNQARASTGLGELRLDNTLIRAAQRHADDMAVRDLMTHNGSDGSTVGDRALQEGYNFAFVGENVLVRPNLHASGAFDQWWNSPPHYENMMDARFDEIGIAYAVSRTGQYYYAMALGQEQ